MKNIYILFRNEELRIFEKATTSKKKLLKHIESMIKNESITVSKPDLLEHLKLARLPASLVASELNTILKNCYVKTVND